MDDLSIVFAEVADALHIGATSIVEKDYYVIELLRLLQPLHFDSHQLVFAGGTALAKAGIRLNRMSEDVDIKLVPQADFLAKSRTQRKFIRKEVIQHITQQIECSALFQFDDQMPHITLDEYRYHELSIRYPQIFKQAPCIRPFIKLELIEADLLEPIDLRSLSSFVCDLTEKGSSVSGFPCVTILSTLAEKIVSLLRRTAMIARDPSRADDVALVRHLYDHARIMQTLEIDFVALTKLINVVIAQDVERFGRQHPQFVENPRQEMQFGLENIRLNPIHQQRYTEFVAPMVFGDTEVTWQQAYTRFENSIHQVLS